MALETVGIGDDDVLALGEALERVADDAAHLLAAALRTMKDQQGCRSRQRARRRDDGVAPQATAELHRHQLDPSRRRIRFRRMQQVRCRRAQDRTHDCQ
ncbi:MAG: hypothetical protein ACREVI_03345 [Steroidobacteraceae bacterium]